ncbi:MAG: ATP-binding protein [Bryobacteraceae bacterium]
MLDEQAENALPLARFDGRIIPYPREHDQIFRPFKRLWGEKYPGAGIGLMIAKRIIERHGGRVWLGEAPPGGGACLKLAIPT